MSFTDKIQAQVEYLTEKTLERIGNKLRSDTIKKLKEDDKIAWRTMVNSIAYNVIKPSDNVYVLEFGTNAPHAKYVHEGRQPGKMPPVDAIKAWVRIKAHRFKKSGFMGVSGVKGNETSINSLSWSIARSIAKKGIKPYPFLKVALNQNEKWINQQINQMVSELTNIANI